MVGDADASESHRLLKAINERAFTLLEDRTRRRMLLLLRESELSATEIAARLVMTPQNVYHHLRAWRTGRDVGVVLLDVGHVVERGPDTVRGPDVAFVRAGRLDLRKTSWVEGGPDLAVEIRSPGDRKGEVEDRVADYLRAGTPLVWMVDPAKRTVTVRRPGVADEVLGQDDEVSGGDVLPGFRADVAAFFEGLPSLSRD